MGVGLASGMSLPTGARCHWCGYRPCENPADPSPQLWASSVWGIGVVECGTCTLASVEERRAEMEKRVRRVNWYFARAPQKTVNGAPLRPVVGRTAEESAGRVAEREWKEAAAKRW